MGNQIASNVLFFSFKSFNGGLTLFWYQNGKTQKTQKNKSTIFVPKVIDHKQKKFIDENPSKLWFQEQKSTHSGRF